MCGAISSTNPIGPTSDTTTAVIPVAHSSKRARAAGTLTPNATAEASSWAKNGRSRAHQAPSTTKGASPSTSGAIASIRTKLVEPASQVCASAARSIWALSKR